MVVVSWETNIAMVNATISAGRRLLYENGYKNMILEMRRYEMGAMKSAVCESSDAVKSQRQ